MKPIIFVAATSVALYAFGASAQTKPAAEPEVVYTTCSQCHGDHGVSTSQSFPNLAAQDKDYLSSQLKAFRDHTRADPHAQAYMWGMAGLLTNETIDEIATYFSSQATPAASTGEDPTDISAGKAVFEKGNDAEQVPACGACHGDTAAGTPGIPRLAGQHREYLAGQLLAFRTNQRNNEVMHANVVNITDAEIRQLASYLASLSSSSDAPKTSQ